MDLSGAGTAIMLAVAAGLWFLYLVPTWVRRREYLATERTATRLQQTMRVLAETAEVPESVRIAATAREAARAERMLRARQRREDAMVARRVRAERAATPASQPVPRMLATATTDALRRQRIRRSRRLASGLMIVATLFGLVQIWLMASTGVSLGGWVVLAATLAAGGVAISMQRRLDARAMPRATGVVRPQRSRIPAALLEGVPTRPVEPAPWTPVAVPQPLYLSRPAVQRTAPPVDAERLMREAAAQAEQAQRATRPPATVTPMRSDPPAAARADSRFAAMGIVTPADTETTDLDEVLRRRRFAG
jgi:hypothetical protein